MTVGSGARFPVRGRSFAGPNRTPPDAVASDADASRDGAAPGPGFPPRSPERSEVPRGQAPLSRATRSASQVRGQVTQVSSGRRV